MSLESQIGILTDAIRALTSSVNALQIGAPAVSTKPDLAKIAGTAQYEEINKVKHADGSVTTTSVGLPPDAELPNVHPSEMPPQTTSPTSEPSEPESAPVTYDDVKKVTIAVSKISKDKAVAGLAEFGVASAKQLIEAQWAAYVERMTAILGE
jgi:hypothetical protein